MLHSNMNRRSNIPANSIILVALMCLLACTPRAFSAEDKIQKIAVIGASASAGFGVFEEIKVSEDSTQLQGISLGDVLIEAKGDEKVVVLDLASGGFFSKPVRFGQASVKRANEWSADLVIAIDFLFWFLYGSTDADDARITNEDQRLEKLEEGLRQLDLLKMFVIIGEVPDMSPAVGKMLSGSQMPDLATIAAANQRIRAWAKERPRVGVIPLHGLISELRSGEPFKIGRHDWDPTAEGIAVILPDRLHPSINGLIALLQSAHDVAINTEGIGDRMPPMFLEREQLVGRIHQGDVPLKEGSPAAPSAEAP